MLSSKELPSAFAFGKQEGAWVGEWMRGRVATLAHHLATLLMVTLAADIVDGDTHTRLEVVDVVRNGEVPLHRDASTR